MPSAFPREESYRAAWSGAPEIDAHWQTPQGRGVLQRARVMDLLQHDREAALEVARHIEHPWYRCQALSYVAESDLSHPGVETLLNAAMAAACEQDEPNRVASVARWPLKALVSVDAAQAAAHAAQLLRHIATEPHGLRRLDGITAILWAVVSVADLRESAFQAFLDTAKECQGWRTERLVDVAVHVIAPFDRRAATRLLSSRPVTRYTRRARELLASRPHETQEPGP